MAFAIKDEEILHLWLRYSQRWGNPSSLMAFAIKDEGNGGYPPLGVQVHPGNSAAPEYLIWEFPLGFRVSRGYPRDFNEISLKTWKSTEIWPNPSGLTVLTPISLISTPWDPFWGGYPPPEGGVPPPRSRFSWIFMKIHENTAKALLSAFFPQFWRKLLPRTTKIAHQTGFRDIFKEFGNPKTLQKHY